MQKQVEPCPQSGKFEPFLLVEFGRFAISAELSITKERTDTFSSPEFPIRFTIFRNLYFVLNFFGVSFCLIHQK
jgi:hypothetical protein